MEQLDICMQKNEVGSLLQVIYKNINSKWIKSEVKSYNYKIITRKEMRKFLGSYIRQ